MTAKPPTATEGIRELLESVLDLLLTVLVSFAQQERAANTARHALIPAGQQHINQLSSSDRHRHSSGGITVMYAMPVAPPSSFCLHVVKNHRHDWLSPAGRLCCACPFPPMYSGVPRTRPVEVRRLSAWDRLRAETVVFVPPTRTRPPKSSWARPSPRRV
jgi:hypothetical protein